MTKSITFPKPAALVEVTRSFSYKLNAGNYESRDFFCSQKAECRADDADMVSERLYQFCKQQVMKAIAQWKADEVAAREEMHRKAV
jgi:hypothetical protein